MQGCDRRSRAGGDAAWWQSRQVGSRPLRDRAGVAQAASDRARGDQAQPKSSRAWRGVVSAAVPEPHRSRHAPRQAAGRFDGGQHGLHAWFARCRIAGKRPSAAGAGHRGGHRDGDARSVIGRLGSMEQRLCTDSRCDRSDLSRHLSRLQRPVVDAGRFSPPPACARTEMANEERQGGVSRTRDIERRSRHARALPDGFASIHTAQRQSVQHDDLSARRPVSRHQRDADGCLDEPADIARRGLEAGVSILLEVVSPDGVKRQVDGFQVVSFDLPEGCIGGYFP
ncbi:hypothetical protein PCAR4_350152 [Paraburkholderia caribensis]|nr:hypothetical protein PCAR4_350152 [Paraburkholderia caribensis]